MKKELSYKKYNQLAKKYWIDAKSREKTIKEKFLKACIELPQYVLNIAKNAILEKSKTDFYYEMIMNKYFRFNEV